MKKKWNEIKRYPLLVLFFVFLFCFMILDALWPKREYSELERRNLQQVPTFSFRSLFSNEWTKQYDKYTQDQFVFRDTWLSLQSRSERVLFFKKEIGGAVIGDDNQQFTKMYALKPTEAKQLSVNTLVLQNFLAEHEGHATFMLAPSASLIYEDRLPTDTPMLDEESYLNDIFAQTGTGSLDLRPAFTAAKDDTQLYYYTDHHWTTDGGAYVAYQAFCETQGFTPVVYAQDDYATIENFYGTTYAKSLLWNTKAETIRYLDLPNKLTVWNVAGTGELTENFTAGLYDMEKVDTMDKYSMFLYGNQGYTTIEGTGTGKLLVIKDSYANSLIPFLLPHYAEIGVVDPRAYKLNINDLMTEQGYEDALVVFNFQTFASNDSVARLMPQS